MKKLFILVLIIFLFFSCSNVNVVEDIQSDSETLKELLVSKEADISWTKALEEDRLLQSFYSDEEKINSYLSITPEIASVIYNDEEPVYPSLKGFTSLDLTSMSSSVKLLINDFCKAIATNIYQGPEVYFDTNYIFNYVFFKYDLINTWNNKFGVEFPLKSPDELKKLKENQLEIKSKTKDEKKEEPNLKQPNLFDKWVLGKPFIGSEIITVPVRFYCQQGYVDVTLSININNNKIYQITEGTYD